MQVSNFVWLYFKPIWRERCRSFSIYVLVPFFMTKIAKYFMNFVKIIIISRISTQNLKSLVSILTELSKFKNIIAKNRNL